MKVEKKVEEIVERLMLIASQGGDLPCSEIPERMRAKDIEKLAAAIKNSYLYPSWGDCGIYNVLDNGLYECVEDLEIAVDYYGDREGFDYEAFERDTNEFFRLIEELGELGVPLVVYENNAPDFYVARVIVLRKL